MKLHLLTVLTFLFITFTSCEKKQNSTTKSSTSSSSSLHTDIFQAKINGNDWQCHPEGYTTGKNASFSFEGQNSLNNPFSSIRFTLPLTATVGVNSFNNTSFIAKYKDTLGVTYSAKTGTIHITAVDTFKYGYKLLKGSFSFQTDTVGGKTFNVTSGAIDFKI